MTEYSPTLRIATYNVHKCRGFDMRVMPERIVSVLLELQADILCLQEVVNAPTSSPVWNQAHAIASAFPNYHAAFGANRPFHDGTYGNMSLSRFPLVSWHNHDLSRENREPRGVLQTEIELPRGRRLHVFNVHLGTGHMERRYQARKLLNPEVLEQPGLSGPRMVLGDFNEWIPGLTTHLLRSSFKTFRPRHAARFPRTFPGMLPLVSLDHCYYDHPLELQSSRLWRSPTAYIASDHLPLVAEFRLAQAASRSKVGCEDTAA
ncbi:MAG TPA: endonuclease/exonuclease/phosphatase family protein [Terracidiphilus sp.]|jgi:endonuclease/exonuclease/phosphatase family metal-dependent hydrolase|nr:endonuclease/exonuclease/phosphatase family protein [Terracidiphilus sp.]